MIILSKLADYGVIVASHLAAHPERQITAGDARRRDAPAARHGGEGPEDAGPCRHRRRRARRAGRLSPGARGAAPSPSPTWLPRSTAQIGLTQCSIHAPSCERTDVLSDPAALAARQRDRRHRARRREPRRDGARPHAPSSPTAPSRVSNIGFAFAMTEFHTGHRTHHRRKLQIRLRHRYRERAGAAGPQRRHRALHLGQEGRAAMAARLAARMPSAAGRRWRARTGRSCASRRSTTRRRPITRRRKQRRRSRSTRSIPSCCRPTRSSAFRCSERAVLAGVAVDAVFDSVSVATTFKAKLGRARHHLLLVRRGGARASRAGAEISRLGRAAGRQFLRRAQLRGVQRRLLRLCAAGRALPDGALDLFPHQCGEDRASSSAPSSSPTRAAM